MIIRDDITPELVKLNRSFPKGMEQAAGQAALAMIQYSNQSTPKPPIETGNLRRSYFAGAMGKIIEKGPDAELSLSYNQPVGEITAIAGYTAHYAIYQHENLSPEGKQWQPRREKATVGGKFLEKSIFEHSREIVTVLVDGLKEWIRKNT